MDKENELYMKFPSVLRIALESGKIKFDEKVQFHFQPIEAFRLIMRKSEDSDWTITPNDFKSYAELGKFYRGMDESNLSFYSVSCNLNPNTLKNLFNLPKPTKKLSKGFVHEDGGPEYTSEDGHIDWWLFVGADISSFKIVDPEDYL